MVLCLFVVILHLFVVIWSLWPFSVTFLSHLFVDIFYVSVVVLHSSVGVFPVVMVTVHLFVVVWLSNKKDINRHFKLPLSNPSITLCDVRHWADLSSCCLCSVMLMHYKDIFLIHHCFRLKLRVQQEPAASAEMCYFTLNIYLTYKTPYSHVSEPGPWPVSLTVFKLWFNSDRRCSVWQGSPSLLRSSYRQIMTPTVSACAYSRLFFDLLFFSNAALVLHLIIVDPSKWNT